MRCSVAFLRLTLFATQNTVFASQVIEESQLQFGYGSALHQPGDDPPAGDGCVKCSCRVSLHA
jgi:hypothetical protein